MIDRIKIWLLDLVVGPYVECPNCKALCEYGKDTKTCWACEAEVVINDDTPVLLSFVQKRGRNEPYTAYVRCPNCRSLLSYGTAYCRHCREELDEQYAFVSSFIEVLKTIACDNARTIASFNPFAVIVVLVTAGLTIFSVTAPEAGFIFLISFLLPFQSLMPLLAVLIWFYRFGAINHNDQDFLYAKRETKRALKLWLLIFAAQLFIVFLLNFPR